MRIAEQSTKLLLIFTIFFLMVSNSCSQIESSEKKDENGFSTFTCKYLTIDYPTSWIIRKEKEVLGFHLPVEPGKHLRSPSFELYFQRKYGYSEETPKIFFESEKDFPSEHRKYFQEEIAGKLAMAYRSNGDEGVINIRYWFEVAPQKEVMIHIAGYSRHLELHWSLFEKIKNSIRLKPQPPKQNKLIEVTNIDLAGEKVDEYIDLGTVPGQKNERFEEIIRGFWKGQDTIKVIDDDVKFNDWNTFFAWKPFSEFKDVQIFSTDIGVNSQLDVFSKRVYLGDYDNLLIQRIQANLLQFDFTKTSGERIKWILRYEGKHKLPLNQKIILNRFTFKEESNFYNLDNSIGKVIIFAINGDKYLVRIESLQVF